MNSQWVCITPECNRAVSKTEVCEKCGKPCQEELDTGEIVMRKPIPEYILKDIVAIEEENTKLMNEWVMNTERFFLAHRGLQVNLDRRIQLQNKMKQTVEGGIRKLRLHKDKEVRWGYDAFRKTFASLRKPVSKVIEEK